MRPVCECWIPGVPKPQPRTKPYAMKGKNGQYVGRMYDPGTADNWTRYVVLAVNESRESIGDGMPFDGPLRLDLHFVMPRPKRLTRNKDPVNHLPAQVRGDIDNFRKPVMDALEALAVYRNDNQVCAGDTTAVYARKDGGTGCFMRLWRIAPDEKVDLFCRPVVAARLPTVAADTAPSPGSAARGRKPETTAGDVRPRRECGGGSAVPPDNQIATERIASRGGSTQGADPVAPSRLQPSADDWKELMNL